MIYSFFYAVTAIVYVGRHTGYRCLTKSPWIGQGKPKILLNVNTRLLRFCCFSKLLESEK